MRGNLTNQQITVIDGNTTQARVLNKHLDLSVRTGSQAERDLSLSTPLGMAISSDGETLYVTAFGSRKVGVFATSELEDNSFTPDAQNQIELSGGGPADWPLTKIMAAAMY